MRSIEIWKARTWAAAVATTALIVAGCGGGGGNGDVATGVDISGVAATGAAMAGATIEIMDKEGNVVATKTAGADGSYTLTIASTAKPPFVASARKGDVVLFSPIAEARTGTINITPITNLMAAQLSPSGDPAALAGEIKTGRTEMNTRQVQAVVKALVEALKPLLVNAGAENVDPLTGKFSANGSGIDKVLNSLNIAINKTDSGSNITITVKAAVAEGDQAPAISFNSADTPPAAGTADGLSQDVATATLPEDNIDQLVAAYVTKLQACYALPKSTRINGSGTNAAAVIAPTCRETFSGNDPANFVQNGSVVSASQAFSSLYRDGATGVKFSEARVDALNADGTMLVLFKSTASDGGVSYSRTWVKKEDGALKAIGNHSTYQFQVRPWAEYRTLINMPGYTYWATGFELSTNAAQAAFDHVTVTPPNGRTITLKPNGALSYLGVVRPANGSSPAVTTSTSVVRLAGKYVNSATSGSPRDLSAVSNGEGLLWAFNSALANTDWTESDIKAIKVQGRWKAEFYLAAAPSTIAATQYYTTSSRPFTISELQQRAWAQLTRAAVADLAATTASSGAYITAAGDRAELTGDNGTDFWTVPAGATPPTTAQVQGSQLVPIVPTPTSGPTTTAVRFNDNTSVSSIARGAVISCSSQGSSDTHCTSPTAGTFAAGNRINFLQLIGFDIAEVEWVSNFGLYKFTP